MSEAMELLPPKQPEYLPAVSDSWDGAAQRGLQARRERESIISQVLKPGIDADYGIIPGTPKATLLKPGAEKIADSLNLYPDYEIVTKIEDFDRPLFHYSYRCRLTARGSNVVIATGIGSCNSMESRYRWREGKRKCPACGKDAIIKGKAEYGGGWLCFQKKDGCGAKFTDKDASITGQAVGRVLNDDIYSQINSIDKVAQKRAFVAATLNLGFSEQFTQDLEDGRVEEEPPAHVLPPTPVGTMGALGVGTQLRSGDPHYVQPQRATVPFVPASAPSARELGDESEPEIPESVKPTGGAQPPENYTFRFGKHKGQTIDQVPLAYLEWWRDTKAKELDAGIDDERKAGYAKADHKRAVTEIARRKAIVTAYAPDEEDIPF